MSARPGGAAAAGVVAEAGAASGTGAAAGLGAHAAPAPSVIGQQQETHDASFTYSPERAVVEVGARHVGGAADAASHELVLAAAKFRPSGLCATLRSRAQEQAAIGTCFAMGLAWKTATLALQTAAVSEGLHAAGSAPEVLWGAALIFILLVVPIIGLLVRRQARLQKRLKSAAEAGDESEAFVLHMQEKSLGAITGWGLTFIVASQIDVAASASLPRSGLWRLLYFASLMLLVCFLALGIERLPIFRRDQQDKGAQAALLAQATLSGSTFVVALALLSALEAALGFDSLSQSRDIAFLAAYTGALLALTPAVLALLAWADVADAKAFKGGEDHAVEGCACLRLNRLLRKFLGGVVTLATATAAYALVFLSCNQALGGEPFSPLPLWASGGLAIASLLLAVLVGCILDWAVLGLAERCHRVDRSVVPGPFDDLALDAVEAMARTTDAAIDTAFGWLVGSSIQAFCTSLFDWVIRDPENAVADLIAAAAYAAAMTAAAVLLSVRMAKVRPPKLTDATDAN